MKLRLFLAGVILLLNFGTAQASSDALDDIRFTHLTIDQGLSESTVSSITQDERGFMWFATQNGLDRYDGYSIEEFTGSEALPNKNIRTLLSDGGQLWLGTWGNGLVQLDLPTGNVSAFLSANSGGAGNDFIRALYRDSQGFLWIGGNNGVDRLEVKEKTFTHYAIPGTDLQTVYAIIEDTPGSLWLGADTGVFQMNTSADSIHPVLQTDGTPVNALWKDASRNQLWVGTRNGLYRFDISSGQTKRYAYDLENPKSLGGDNITSLFSDRSGMLWIGHQNGADLMNPETPGVFRRLVHDENDPFSLASGRIFSIFQDRDGGVWLGAWAMGVSYYHPTRFKFSSAIALPSFPVSFAHGENNTLWVGTFEQGLFQLGSNYQTIANYQRRENDSRSLPDNAVMALWQGRDRLWIGTLGGLCWLDSEQRIQTYPAIQGRVRSLYEGADGALWVGTSDGLFHLDSAGRLTHYQHNQKTGSLSNNNILVIFQDHSGALWFGTDNGLNRLEDDFTFSQPVTLDNVAITVIHEDAQNNLWLGTWGSGLAKIDAERKTVRYYAKTEGLANNIILGILQDDENRLWISASRGLSRFNLQDDSFRTFGLGDGLTDIDFAQGSFTKLPNGLLLFGAASGIVHFNPANLPTNQTPPAVLLTNFQIYNRDVRPGPNSPLSRGIEYTDHLTLRHDQSIFSLEFAALNYIGPENSTYAYLMDGVDPDWNYTSDRRFVTYTNLNPGEYTFRVRAANGDGIWNDDGVSLRVTILPPWWKTWWAYSLYALILVGSAVSVVALRNRQFREKFATQQKLLEQEQRLRSLLEQLDVIQEEDRRRIAHEMHDGLAQTLASLRLRSRVWHTFLKKSPEKLPAEFDDLAQTLDDSIQEVRRSIFELRPIVLDEQGLSAALKLMAEEMGKRYGIEIQANISCGEGAIHPSMEHTLFRVAQELLNNVGKHARANRAAMDLSCDQQIARLTVSDDGKGFDPNRLETESTLPLERGGLGLRQIRERAEILGGRLLIEDAAPGTRVIIELPLVQ